jgi:mRNA-degrading endonuclease toxin of MazEF toxin-antitoxin module
MPRPSVGEVWLVDLGLAAKVRPCLILSDYPADGELALVVVVPHTTAVRGNRWELAIAGSERSFSSQLDRVGRLNADKRVVNSSGSRAAESSLQPAGFWRDHRGEKALLEAVEG